LHKDNSTPIVAVSVMYHVGSKDEDPTRTGFAHFFEHLLFEGSDNIKRGEYMKLVQANGGQLNANTTQDRTFYYEVLPSNQLELALWMESERMLHAKIDSEGVETQRKVVKEEKKQRFDNTPYGQLINVVFENSFTKHPYRWSPIGTDQYLDMATLPEFMSFYKLFYVPNNATLVIGGDIDIAQTKALIDRYFGTIPKGTQAIPRPNVTEPQQTAEKRVKFYDNIQLPALVYSYHTPKMGTDDYYAVQMLTQLLAKGNSSRLRKAIVDEQEKAVEAAAIMLPSEDPGISIVFGITNMGVPIEDLEKAMDAEIDKVKTGTISEEEFQKLKNQVETDFISQNERILGVVDNLATYHVFLGNANLINTELDRYAKVTKDDLQRVAKKYFTKENRAVIYYLPKSEEKKQ
jgi:predicted Zn-dependent peptidase